MIFSADSLSDSEDTIFVDVAATFAERVAPKASKNQTEIKLFMNYMWAHKPHTNTKRQSVGGHDNFGITQN